MPHCKEYDPKKNFDTAEDSSGDSAEETPIIHKMDPKVAQEMVDLNPVDLFNKKDKKSSNNDDTETDDSQMCIQEGTKKNPDDEGEGDNVQHSEDLVGIKNTRIKKRLK